MEDKLYQVFISSTYSDLEAERSAVEQTLLACGCVPIGMERFPSTNKEQFEYIKSIMNYIDYYILIIGGRYGTINDETGLSYTEMEYDYAVDMGIPILVFLKDKSTITQDKMDKHQVELEAFTKKVSSKRLRNEFKNQDELKVKVMQAINFAKSNDPRPGWVRANFGNPAKLLLEINNLRNENEELKENIKKNDDVNFDILLKNIDLRMSCRYSNIGDYFEEVEFIESFLVIFAELSRLYLLEGKFNVKMLNIVCQKIFKESQGDYYAGLEQRAKEAYEMSQINSHIVGNYFQLTMDLHLDSFSSIMELLVLEELMGREKDTLHLTPKGRKTYKKIKELYEKSKFKYE